MNISYYIGINIVIVLFYATNGRLNVMNAPEAPDIGAVETKKAAIRNFPYQTAA